MWALSHAKDASLLDFACTYDKVFLQGPYHYARITGDDRRARALTFLTRLTEISEGSLLEIKEATAPGLARLRKRLRKVSLAFRRGRSRTCGDKVAHTDSLSCRLSDAAGNWQQDESSAEEKPPP